MRPNPRDPGEGTHRIALALLLFSGLLLLYTASASLTFHSDDEHILAARAQSLAAWGNLGQTQVFGNARVQELRAQGDAATEVEPGHVVLGAVGYRIAQQMGFGGAQGFLLTQRLHHQPHGGDRVRDRPSGRIRPAHGVPGRGAVRHGDHGLAVCDDRLP